MPLIKAVVYVPVEDNDGQPFSVSLWRELEDRLRGTSSGLTRLADVTGMCSDGERQYRDRSRQYSTGLSSWADLPGWLDAVRWAREHFRQEAMYVEIAGIRTF